MQKSNFTLIEPDSRTAGSLVKAFPRSSGLPDLPDWSAFEEIDDGNKDVREHQSGDCASNNPQVNFLRRYEA